EIFNILVDFWHTNIFGGIWASIILLINWILIFVHVCCTTTVGESTCSFVWHWITLVALGVVIAFDIIPQFSSYTIYDSKKFLLEIQVGCTGLVFILTIIYIIIFIVCRIKFSKRDTTVYPIMNTHTPKCGLRVAQAPPIPNGNQPYLVRYPPN
ncbi:unnamed protein product, partial [Rotaria sp. Silwood2]